MKEIVREHTDREDILGKFATKDDFDLYIDEDCDLYNLNAIDPNQKDEGNIIFKFRKGVFTKEEQDLAYKGLREAATESQNRGMAAGPRGDTLGSSKRGHRDWVTPYQLEVIDYYMGNHLFDDFPEKTISTEETRGQVWLRSKVIGEKYGDYDGWFDRWVTRMHNQPKEVQAAEAEEVTKMISYTQYAQTVLSGIAGYYDRYPRIPYGRACGYNEREPEKFEMSFPYLRKLNEVFKKELPVRWAAQRACANKLDPKFLIDETVFTTLTVNYNWRTAGHRDAGDLSSGFSNISGVGRGWKGFVFTLPEWKVGINLQPGDLLLVSNHEGIHTNTEAEGDDNDRVSIVAYFREKMLELKSWDYEMTRKQFVEDRRKNLDHPLQRPLWNGVSPGMWETEEWKEYMKANNISDPYGSSTIEGFF
jgi:hypothetical protein